jgi:hypothetical protein
MGGWNVKRAVCIGSCAIVAAFAILVGGERMASGVQTEHHYEGETAENDYGRKGVFEVGGSVAFAWNKDIWDLDLTPSLGYFVADRVQLSLLIGISYESARLPDGTRGHQSRGTVLVEPSYHLPLCDMLLVFGGLGAGLAYNGSNPAFALEPRIGLNVEVGRSGVFSPAFAMPILFGSGQGGPIDDSANVLLGVVFEAGFTTTF